MTDFTALPDLAARALGGSVVYANDELFAARENLINPERAVFDPDEFGPKGKVYDGWETRRRRTAGSDHAIVRLGAPGVVHGVVVDTAWFTGNFPPSVSVEGTSLNGYPSVDELSEAEWPGYACTGRWSPIRLCSPGRSTSGRSRTAVTSSTARTCTTRRRATC